MHHEPDGWRERVSRTANEGATAAPRLVTRGEQEFARLLDYYRIEWLYEPRSFPLRWDDEGNVTEAFTPDFCLLDHDLYVELTSMKQALASRKNRKLRLLRQLNADVNVKVLYRGDCQALFDKYGLGDVTEPDPEGLG
jgi:hypothetical protein